MKRSIIITLALIAAIAVPLCASSGWARGLGVLGMVGGGASACSTVVAENTTSTEIQDLFGTTVKGYTFSAASTDVICGIQFYVSSVIAGPHTLTLRVGPTVDLTTTYAQGTLSVSSANNGSWVLIPLSTTITGSTTYYFGVLSSGTIYNTRVALGGTDASSYGAVSGWVLSARSGRPLFKAMK